MRSPPFRMVFESTRVCEKWNFYILHTMDGDARQRFCTSYIMSCMLSLFDLSLSSPHTKSPTSTYDTVPPKLWLALSHINRLPTVYYTLCYLYIRAAIIRVYGYYLYNNNITCRIHNTRVSIIKYNSLYTCLQRGSGLAQAPTRLYSIIRLLQ